MKNKQSFIILSILAIVFFLFSVCYYLYFSYGLGRGFTQNKVTPTIQLTSNTTEISKDKKPFDCSIYEKQIKDSLDPKLKTNDSIYQVLKDRCLSSFKTYFNDFTGDGIDEVVLLTYGAGCASCHAQQLLIFKDSKLIFEKDGLDLVYTLNPDIKDEFILQSQKSVGSNNTILNICKYDPKSIIFQCGVH